MTPPAGEGVEPDELSGTYETAFGELTFDDETPPDLERRHRNNRVLKFGIAIGAVVVLAVGVLGIVLIRGYLDDTTSLTARMSVKYQAQYRRCLDAGTARGTCATRAEAACAQDPGWSVEKRPSVRLREIGDICLFGPDTGS